jgi:hypothetical protein
MAALRGAYSAMVFHDLASPDVTEYHAARIMAVAWSGDFRPVAHQPDPRIDRDIPDHVTPLLA